MFTVWTTKSNIATTKERFVKFLIGKNDDWKKEARWFFQSDIKSFLSVFNFSFPCVSDIFYCPAHVVNSKIPYLK